MCDGGQAFEQCQWVVGGNIFSPSTQADQKKETSSIILFKQKQKPLHKYGFLTYVLLFQISLQRQSKGATFQSLLKNV